MYSTPRLKHGRLSAANTARLRTPQDGEPNRIKRGHLLLLPGGAILLYGLIVGGHALLSALLNAGA